MRGRIELRNNIAEILAFFVTTVFLVSDLGGSVSVYVAFIIAISVYAIMKSDIDLLNIKRNLPFLALFIVTLIMSFHDYDYKDMAKNFYLLMSVLGIVSIFSADRRTGGYKKIQKFFVFSGTFVALLIYFQKLFPSVFSSLFLPLYINSSAAEIVRLTSQGYSICVNGDIAYTLTLVMFALFCTILETGRKHRVWHSILLFGALLLSQRRTEILGSLVVIIIVYFIRYRKTLFKDRLFLFCFISSIFVCLCLLIGLFIFIPENFESSNRIMMTLHDIKYNVDFLNGRDELYTLALEIFEEKPISGIGWMNFSRYAAATGNTLARNVHCIYLQLLTECGVLGASFIYLVIGILLFKSFKQLFRNEGSLVYHAYILYFILAGVVDNTIYYPYFWIFVSSVVYMNDVALNNK